FVAHSQWIAGHIDRYCVADPEVRHELIARGIPVERILVTGVPVLPEFSQPVARAAAREDLGLSTRAPVVLAMAGSQGELGRLPDVARVLTAMRRPLQGLVVVGHDPRLKATLTRLTEGTTIRTLGYAGDVRRLMAAADILVTKAGGMTLAEAMAAEAPLLLYGSLPGQERRNERFAARAGIALVARHHSELTPLLERAFDEPELLERLRARMRRLRRPGRCAASWRRVTRSVATAGRTGVSGSAARAAPRTRSAVPIAFSPMQLADRSATSVRPGAW